MRSRRLAKRARHPSNSSHNTASVARASRSHSPSHLLKPAKRRNTMNSRDAAYDETLMKEIMEATAAEATAANKAPSSVNGSVNGHGDVEEQAEAGTNSRRKRKRLEDDAASVKRTRSASTTSDRPLPVNATREETPASVVAAKVTTTMPAPPPKTSRNRRGGGRKSAAQAQDLASVDGDEAAVPTSSRRATNSRAKAAASTPARRGQASGSAAHEHGTRRNYSGGTNGAGAASHAPGSSATRAYHNSHAYVVSQQPLLTSWSLPDYLAHLEHILPTDVPQPLEVRASGADSTDRSLERGVKIKWPSKRMSVGDMNKRVRALVEWVGREQASTLERGRRREALEAALRETATESHAVPNGVISSAPGEEGPDRNDAPMVLDGPPAESPIQEKPGPTLPSENELAQLSTMKMMEELMEELIGFQERFGPGAKSKERERRTATS
ncbi:hypothetical protein DENSPDRAFT_840451 [Dentipellis sp. KUC8613]|nr:hypothetical protein DENSPDRAFT_840451 [Dentipellis sp. KUC8613]